MATQIVINMERPPSASNPIELRGVKGKEDELKYLWTALVILGQTNPKMCFSADSIEVTGITHFDSEKQQRRRSFFKKEFTDESFYAKHFKNHKDVIDSYVKDVLKQTNQKDSDSKKTKEVDVKVQKNMKQSLTEGRDEMKQKLDQHLKSEGIFPEFLIVPKIKE